MEITILTYNFIGIPLFSKNYRKRLNCLIDGLSKLKPDIICLQEVWMDTAKEKIIASLKTLGYNFYFPSRNHRLCGLLVGYKGIIVDSEFISTKDLVTGFDLSFLEALGSKGFIHAKLSAGG